MATKRNFPQKLRELRISKKLSQGKLAKLSGVSQTAIYHWETGKRHPKVEQIYKLANALNVPVLELLEELHVEESGKMIEEIAHTELNEESINKMHRNIEKLRMISEAYFNEKDKYYEEKERWAIKEITKYLKELTPYGQEEAVNRVKELTHIPKFSFSIDKEMEEITITLGEDLDTPE